jgi:hypothetical protein
MGCTSDSSVKTNERKKPRKENLNEINSQLSIKKEGEDIKKEQEILEISKNSEINDNDNDNEKNENIDKNKKKKITLNDYNEEDNKIILPPATKEFIVEGNDTNVNKNYKKRAYQGVTILENIKNYFPENIERDFIKDMVYNTLGQNIVKDESQFIKGKNLTVKQVDGIIDVIFKIVHENENVEKNEVEDERLKDVKVNIMFYDANEENIRKFIFKDKNPTDEEVENTLKQFNSGEEEVKILGVEILDK